MTSERERGPVPVRLIVTGRAQKPPNGYPSRCCCESPDPLLKTTGGSFCPFTVPSSRSLLWFVEPAMRSEASRFRYETICALRPSSHPLLFARPRFRNEVSVKD